MKQENFITGNSEDEIWQQINEHFAKDAEMLEYYAVIIQNGRKIILEIDIDLGGGFESGYETTTLTSHLNSVPAFRFAIHDEHFSDGIGKFFGMQDLIVGFKEFDDKFIIKTNDKAKTRKLFSNPSTRKVFESLSDFTLGLSTHHENDAEKKDAYLELNIESGVTNVGKLRELYNAFYAVLIGIEEGLPRLAK